MAAITEKQMGFLKSLVQKSLRGNRILLTNLVLKLTRLQVHQLLL